ncbi:molybdenum-dependent oxidoreductase-like protein [Mumia flava]|uniref:Molybdenum-dependent oxidoreductase-like protein n=1 Tax=Mumia flava TaxID=1348852 RepID=A0A0B2B9U5_9ACTN|nr:sulfite oxidase [Mumia flava]PJJ48266.1 molybdenum-dependent oxidoreductase-like protein [Mumia flava]
MTDIDSSVSPPAALAERDDAITIDELRLATRNHGMPLEVLDLDVTPPGLHYVLVHYDIPLVDPATWTLEVDGHVDTPLSLTAADLDTLPAASARVTLECAGNGRARTSPRPLSQPWLDEAVGTASWSGVRLDAILERAGVLPGAVDVVFTGADHGVERGVEQDYQRALSVEEIDRGEAFLATSMNGVPLPPQHGAPLRLVVPGWYGMAHVKWLTRITVLDHAFDGFQNATAYRIKTDPDDPGVPVTRIEPRALIRPPGFPDFQTRTRVVDAGPVTLSGRAWSGHAPIERVEVSTDDGTTWSDAEVEPAGTDPYAWRRWTARWDAEPGRTVLRVRATDASGRSQPLEQQWNRQAMANSHAQAVPVLVRG